MPTTQTENNVQSSTANNVQNSNITPEKEQVKYGVFTGVYNATQKALYERMSKYLPEVKPAVSHKVCEQLACDLGRLDKANREVKFGKKLDDNGRIKVRSLVKDTMIATNATSLYILLEAFMDLAPFGLHLLQSKLALKEDMNKWLAEIEAKLAENAAK